jgi:hypothetical protein
LRRRQIRLNPPDQNHRYSLTPLAVCGGILWLGYPIFRAMNWTLVIYGAFVAWCISASGCTICQNAMRTVWHEPAAYSWKHDRRRSVEAYRQWADAALADEAGRCPDLFGEPDYVMGFRDGFVDFVYLGGTGEPPPVPPRHFWNVMLRSPEGKVRANLWFDGYRHGAAVARDGGYRELGRVHSSLVGFASGPQYSAHPWPLDGSEAYGHVPSPDGEPLPEPPRAAPALTPPVQNGDTSVQEPAGEPPPQPAPLDTPIFTEPPFGDDTQPPAEENNDQPLSMNAPATEQLEVQPLADSAGSETPIEAGDVETFDVKPAVLLSANDSDDQRRVVIVTNNSPVSTARFIDEPATVDPPAKPFEANRPGRGVIRTGFRGWSRRVAY